MSAPATSPSPAVRGRHRPLQSPRPLLYSYDAPTPLPLDSRTTTTAHPFRGAVPLALIFFFFVGFFSVYLLRDLVEHLASAWHARRGGNTPGPGGAAGGSGGLDPAALDAFPVCRYSSVKEGKCGAECAVCLSEFSGDDAVRVLTACQHAFHRGCIDPWLASHATCPVCRSDLGKPPEKAAAGPEEEGRGSAVGAGMAAQNFELIQMGIP